MEYVTLHPFEFFSAVALFIILLLLVLDRKNKTIVALETEMTETTNSRDSIHTIKAHYELLITLREHLHSKTFGELKLKHDAEFNRYRKIIDLEQRTNDLSLEFHDRCEQAELKLSSLNKRFHRLRASYSEKKSIYNRLIRQISEHEEDLKFMEYGVYRPHFTHLDMDDFKAEILSLRKRQKSAIKDGIACICHTTWQIDNSYTKGTVMVNREQRLMLRAFNGECDAAIAKASWNNATTMEERIRRAFRMINKLSKSNHMELTDYYLNMKLEEFRLHYEKHLKIKEEKEEQRATREALREEQKLQKDVERAKADAEKKQALYDAALKKAKEELKGADYILRSEIETHVKELEQQLKEALEKKERALSQAQQTRAGFVYIISNIGCFGDDVYKIGLTRRLEPVDRVRELSGASVPFPYDVHGMIYSEDAPTLEHKLHQRFEKSRINMVNQRKEFFRVPLSTIQTVVTGMGLELKLTKLAEAQQYRETLAMINKQEDLRIEHDRKICEFPDSI